ncbi:MAG: methionyl-tRNA formyltransferase [Deltaproteobacteria bacterium]|nr:methionyl-tRNA formyltransferase [Deltaproteobacteria bacterium]MCX7952069.1 methionyl-tRNA formyltransferase [Deltaproteobacteria bacterium]
MKIIFCGNTDFSCRVLEVLSKNFDVMVITKKNSVVEKVALEKGILTISTLSLKKEIFHILPQVEQPDFILSCDFGLFIPRELFARPRIESINVHTSLLPKYRGPAPIQRAIMNGESKTGITYIKISEKVDAGDIYASYEINLSQSLIYSEVREELISLTCNTICFVISSIARGSLKPSPQDEAGATYAPKITPEEEKLELKNALATLRHIHALSYNPGAYVIFRGRRLKILRCKLAEVSVEPGWLAVFDKRIFLGCSDQPIEILECQTEGGRRLSGLDFVNGYHKLLPSKVL